MKTLASLGKIAVKKPGTNRSWYTMRFIIFDPKKHFIGSDEAKEILKKELNWHISKKQLKDEYSGMYAVAETIGKGKMKHIEFNTCAKTAANAVIIIPNKVKREARKEINCMSI